MPATTTVCVDCQRPLRPRPGADHPLSLLDEHGSDPLCDSCAIDLVARAGAGQLHITIVIGAVRPVPA